MRRNTSGQVIGAQMISASDGSAFTGSVTVYVTGDGGTQAVGSVGSGACTHEGQGFHTYAPSQSETNFNHVAFTFTGTGAIPTTIQIYTNHPQSGDAFVRLGAPAGASVSADIAAVQADTDNIQTRLPAALVSGRMDVSVGAMEADVITSGALAASAVTEIQTGLSTLGAVDVAAAVWNAATASYGTAGSYGALVETNLDATVSSRSTLTAGQVNAEADAALADVGLTTTVTGRIDAAISTRLASASYSAPLDAAGVRGAVGLASANLDTQLSAIDDFIDTEVGAVKTVTDKLDTAMELDGSVYRFTVNALEQAPVGGGGGSTDWTADERAVIRAVLGIPASGTTPADPTAGILDVIRDNAVAIKAKTDNLPAAPAAAGDIPSASTVAAAVRTNLTTELGRIDAAVSTRLASASYSAPPSAATIRAEIDANSTKLDVAVSSRNATAPDNAGIAAIKTRTDLIPAAPAAVGDVPTALQVADALLARDLGSGANAGSPNERTVRSALRFVRNKWSIAGGTLTVTREDDTTVAWTAPVSTNPSADPIVGIDPT